MTIKYGISIVSALHVGWRWSLRPPGCFFASVETIIQKLVKLGYDGVQMIPVWGLEVGKVHNQILLFEGPWNAIPSFLAALRHEFGTLGVESHLQDWIVSPPPDECDLLVWEMSRVGIWQIHHDLGSGNLVEFHKGLNKSASDIVEVCQDGKLRLVLDLRHPRWFSDRQSALRAHYGATAVESRMATWQEIITCLAPWIDVIHVQPGDDETPDGFAGDPLGSETGQLLLHALQQIEAADPDRELVLVAEYHPGVRRILNPWASRRLASDYLKAMKLIVEEAEG